MAQTDKLYVVRTATDVDKDGMPEIKLCGVFTTKEGAEACADEIKGRSDVQRHNVTTSDIKTSVTEINADTYYEEI